MINCLKDPWLPTNYPFMVNPSIDPSLNDKLIWSFTKNVRYSVKSRYHIASQLLLSTSVNGHSSTTNLSSTAENFLSRVWGLKVPPKIRIFMWKLLLNKIPVGMNLQVRCPSIPSTCRICGLFEESVEHLFYSCFLAKSIWFHSELMLRSDCFGQIPFNVWWVKVFDGLTTPFQRNLMAVICWRIWIARNDKCFNNSEWTVSEVNSRALAQLHEFSSAHVLNNQSSAIVNRSTRQVQRWRPPPPGMIKINFDAALSISNRIAAVGLVCSNSSGYITYSCSHRFPGIVSPEIAEALGMRHVIMIASQLGLKNIIIEGDCLNVISASQGKKDIPSTIDVIIFDTVRLSSSFISCDFAYVKRMSNWMAHEVAKKSLKPPF
ncbi:uncharacterized protein LOC126668508 [Mercurialis annua]|uniref:uncharacterized protein LOC126668508 n=1 Tax=Mercurialis annua TaxID=3986 RepID=UPI00215ECB92|nr:uncharacterized protein LOC126668508 [Mercurialis annua]